MRAGDSVLILGRNDPRQGTFDGWLLVTGFSSSGVVTPAPGQSPEWIFEAAGFSTPAVPVSGLSGRLHGAVDSVGEQ